MIHENNVLLLFLLISLRGVLAVFVSVKVQHLPKEDKVKLSVDFYTYSWAFLG